jgi:hypothetical protein
MENEHDHLTEVVPDTTLISEGIMRVEATIPDSRGEQLDEAAKQLGVSRSQLIDEALVILLTSFMEAGRQGLRLALIDSEHRVVRELLTPSLAQLEWHQHREKITLSARAGSSLLQSLDDDSEPKPALKKLFARRPK